MAEHVLRSSGRPHCHCEDVPLQFVFGPELSLEKFKEANTHTHTQIHRLKIKVNVIKKKQNLLYQNKDKKKKTGSYLTFFSCLLLSDPAGVPQDLPVWLRPERSAGQLLLHVPQQAAPTEDPGRKEAL